MLKLLTCIQGHFWEVPQLNGDGEPLEGASCRCPVCGALADELPLVDLAPDDTPAEIPTAERIAPKPSPLVDAKGAPLINGYEVLAALGKGKKGVALYRAKQVLINRVVLLKVVLAKEDTGQIAWGALRGEANALAKMVHPHIPQVYEVGERERQLFYNIVELFDGVPLSQRLAGKPVPPMQAAKLVESIARAVHFAHEKGVVHRSLKPGSILVEAAPDKPLDRCAFKIIDFGLAGRPVEGDVNDLELQDKLPSSLSPEQVWGYSKDIGPSSDIYALGVLLYELLTGRPPYRGERASEILEQIRSRPAAPPRRVNTRVPEDLDGICRKCLQKAPRKRYATALALAEDLRRYQDGLPVRAQDNGLGTRFFKFVVRRPAVACILLLLPLGSLATLVAFVFGLLQGATDQHPSHRASQDSSIARSDADLLRLERDKARESERLVTYYHDIGRADLALREGRFAEANSLLQACPAPLRGWEWDYLDGLLAPNQGRGQQALNLQLGKPITCIAFSPDGRHVAVGTDADMKEIGSLFVWDIFAQGDNVGMGAREFPGAVGDVAFSPDGNWLAMLCAGRKDLRTGEQLRILVSRAAVPFVEQPLPRHATSLHYSPDGRYLAMAGDDGRPWLFNGLTGDSIPFAQPHKPPLKMISNVGHLAFSPDGRRLAYGSEKLPDVTVTDYPSGNNLGVIRTQLQGVTALAYAPDGHLAIGGRTGEVRILDTALAERKALTSFNGKVQRVLFSSDGKRLAALGPGPDGKPLLRWYDGNNYQEILTVSGLAGQINALALDKQGRRLAVASVNNVRIYGPRINP